MHPAIHSISYAAVRQALAAARISVPPAEAHGWLSGALCGRRPLSVDDWLQELLDADFTENSTGDPSVDYSATDIITDDGAHETDLAAAGRVSLAGSGASETLSSEDSGIDISLRRLYDGTLAALQGNEMQFAPLLPGDETPLEHRTETLALWCEGFLFGLGTHASLNQRLLAPDLREIVSDFAEISRAAARIDGTAPAEQEGGNEERAEEEEGAYTELIEFVRVGVQLLHDELSRELDS